MTTDQAAARFEKEAKRLRDLGAYDAAHDWQRMATEMRSLARTAESLPAARLKKQGLGRKAF